MALDTSNGLSYFLCIATEHSHYLAAIRHWSNLKIAFEEELVWIKDLSAIQADSIEVKSIPFKELYYSSGHKLFLKGSLLPDRNIPSVLWTPIERGLPVRLPAFNHNFFGIENKAGVKIVKSVEEREGYALMVNMSTLSDYIEKAPAVRLKGLGWAMVDGDKALILGNPLLPLQGEAFWRMNDFLLPAGYQLELHALADTLNELLNAEKDQWIIWNTDGSYWKINKQDVRPLSISSVRAIVQQLTVIPNPRSND
ncbi:MAG: hypothetical protein WCF67_06270 [Chitinophagaceae bacterium]